MRLLVLIVSALMIGLGSAIADDAEPKKPAKPLTTEQAAGAVLKAVEAKDDKALKALAEKDNPDPWLVADELCFRGEHDAAAAFAKGAPRKDTERLPEFVTRARKQKAHPEVRRALARSWVAIEARKGREMYEIVSGLTHESEDVLGVKILLARAAGLAAAREKQEAHAAMMKAATVAERIGWLAQAAFVLNDAARIAVRRGDHRAAAELWERQAIVERQRGTRLRETQSLYSAAASFSRVNEGRKALSFFERAHETAVAIENRAEIAKATYGVGWGHFKLGNDAKALAYYSRSLKMEEALGHRDRVGQNHREIAYVYRNLGLLDEAAAHTRKAAALYELTRDRRMAARTMNQAAGFMGELGHHEEEARLYERAVAIWEEIDDHARLAESIGNLGNAHFRLGNLDRAKALYERALKTDRRPWHAALMHCNIAAYHLKQGEDDEARSSLERALEVYPGFNTGMPALQAIARVTKGRSDFGDSALGLRMSAELQRLFEKTSNRYCIASCLYFKGVIHVDLDEHVEAWDAFRGAARIFEELDQVEPLSSTLQQLYDIGLRLGKFAETLAVAQRGIELHKRHEQEVHALRFALGRVVPNVLLGSVAKGLRLCRECVQRCRDIEHKWMLAQSLITLGEALCELRDHAAAVGPLEEALAICEGLGDTDRAVLAMNTLARAHGWQTVYAKADEIGQAAVAKARNTGNRAREADALASLSRTQYFLGNYMAASEISQRSLELNRQLGRRMQTANSYARLGDALWARGDLSEALSHYERALVLRRKLKQRLSTAASISSLGNIYHDLGNYERALALRKESLAISEDAQHRLGSAVTLGDIGNTLNELGRYAEAATHLERALSLQREMFGEPYLFELANLGRTYAMQGNHERADELLGDALAAAERKKRPRAKHWILEIKGRALKARGDLAGALAAHEAALQAAPHEAAENRLTSLSHIAVLRMRLGATKEALAAAEAAIPLPDRLTRGFSDEQQAIGRDTFALVFGVGVAAAAKLGDKKRAALFLERGRAAALRGALRDRTALSEVALPRELVELDTKARWKERHAQDVLRRAIEGGALAAIRTARQRLDAVQDERARFAERIEREARRGGVLLSPSVASLDAMQGWMKEDEALVLYSLLTDEAFALAITRGGSKLVSLGPTREIIAAVSDLDVLRKRVLDPLKLKARRLIVSPDGVLLQAPFAQLTDAEVVYVPSGTTYGMLREESATRGEGVVALGDPDYGRREVPGAVAVMRSGRKLIRLPATRAEAKAIGDVTLLGRNATEASLANALSKRRRWRAVHLACHGMIRTDRPRLSSLAFAPDAENDGFLTVLEVYRMHLPADLVVLSACETAKGKVYRAEGVIGFVRAFLIAGAPRVLVSLWKVDDEATKALMVKFYELWKTMPTATALKRAQAFVASHEKWEDPYYWAAWQLWGLPD